MFWTVFNAYYEALICFILAVFDDTFAQQLNRAACARPYHKSLFVRASQRACPGLAYKLRGKAGDRVPDACSIGTLPGGWPGGPRGDLGYVDEKTKAGPGQLQAQRARHR